MDLVCEELWEYKIKLPLIVTCSHIQVKLENIYIQYGMK